LPSTITAYRVFIASPGGLENERQAFKDIINGHNDLDALERGVIFRPIGWENVRGGIGRPQHLINQDVKRCDYFVLVLFDRWGSPPQVDEEGEFKSGSEEEFGVAQACHREGTMRNIVILFKDVPSDRLGDAGPQLKVVHEFRKRLEKEKKFFFENFDGPAAFEDRLRRHLLSWVRDHERGPDRTALESEVGPAAPAVAPPTPVIETPVGEGSETNSEVVQGAEALVKQGLFAEAEEALAQVIPQASLDSLNEYGSLLVEKGSLESAEKVFRQVQALADEQGKREWVISSLNNLASVYLAQGRRDLAEASYRDALAVQEAALGPDHPDVGVSLNRLAELYRSDRRYDDAEELLRRALKIQGINIDD
jgi:hypothetical protein